MPNPSHKPTVDGRKQARTYAAVGVPHHDVARLIGVSTKTLLKHYATELELGKAQANAEVGKRLFTMTATNVAAAIFWMKAQAGWREVQVVQAQQLDAKGNPIAPLPALALIAQNVTVEAAEQVYLSLLG